MPFLHVIFLHRLVDLSKRANQLELLLDAEVVNSFGYFTCSDHLTRVSIEVDGLPVDQINDALEAIFDADVDLDGRSTQA